MTEKRNINKYVMDLILIVYFAELVFPVLNTFIDATIVQLACIMSWIVVSVLQNRSYYLKPKINIALCILFYFIAIFYSYFCGQSVIAHRYASLALVPFAYIIFDYYSVNEQLHRLRKIIYVTYALAIVTAVITFKALLLNPYISRSIKSGGEYSVGLARQGIGGYSFIYFVVASGIIFLHCACVSSGKLKKILSTLGFVFSVIFAMKSNYMTALIILFISSLMYFIINGLKKGNKSIIYIIFISAVCIVIVLKIDTILDLFRDFLPERISRVIYSENNESLIHSITEEFVLDRWPTMKGSIDTFKMYPIFGAVGGANFYVENSILKGIGQHSYILDTFAFFGFGLGVWSLYVIAQPYRDKRWKKSSNNVALTVAMGICIFSLFLFNNATESIALVSGIVMPLIRCKDIEVEGE